MLIALMNLTNMGNSNNASTEIAQLTSAYQVSRFHMSKSKKLKVHLIIIVFLLPIILKMREIY